MNSFERLSAQDAAFLEFEDENTPMHVAALAIFDPRAAVAEGNPLPMDSVRQLISTRLNMLPKYRKRIARVPIIGHPVWVDDEHFDLRQHLKHLSLPKPGDWATLLATCEEFISTKLDRDRPLWELWVLEGMEDGRVALIGKVHHCLIDGVSGVDMMMLLLGIEPTMELPEEVDWSPTPIPTSSELLSSEARRILDLPGQLFATLRQAVKNPASAIDEVRNRAEGVLSAAQILIKKNGETGINGDLGPHRQFRVMRIDLEEVKRFRRALGGTVNDIAVAIVAGALRRFLEDRGEDVDGVDLRATIPMSTRLEIERQTLGNKLAIAAATIPVREPDVRRRIDAARHGMEALKESKQALVSDMLTRVAEWTSPTVLTRGVKFALKLHLTHMMITNIRGPAETLYCMAAPMTEVYPAPELWTDQSLAIGVLSYGQHLHLGFVANRENMGDLDDFVDAFETELAEIREIVPPPAPPRQKVAEKLREKVAT